MSPSTSKGFTFIEILTVLVIIGILIAVGFQRDGGDRVKEVQAGDSARLDLEIIYNAQKQYRIEKGAYLSAGDVRAINAGLGIDISNNRFNYEVQSTPDGFRATATRRDGSLCRGKRMTMTQTGEISKECSVW